MAYWPAEIRRAVKDAEERARTAWLRAGIARTNTPLDQKCFTLHQALAAARKAAREEVRGRHLAEEAAAAT
jgi:hypothetical protein